MAICKGHQVWLAVMVMQTKNLHNELTCMMSRNSMMLRFNIGRLKITILCTSYLKADINVHKQHEKKGAAPRCILVSGANAAPHNTMSRHDTKLTTETNIQSVSSWSDCNTQTILDVLLGWLMGTPSEYSISVRLIWQQHRQYWMCC
jgi:hypothetical protein